MDDSLEQKQAFSLHQIPTDHPGALDSHAVRHTLPPNSLIDHRFRVVRELGRGGAGTVYQVEQVLLKQEFAMKVLDPVGVSEETWRRFQKEAQAAGRLDHAGFVKVHDFGLLEGTIPYFTMDLVRGETLAQRIRHHGPISWQDAIPLFVQLCFALDYAHHRGIVHRDLKPSNISLFKDDITGDTKVKILDFGIAKLIGSDTASLTQAGTVFGTPFYMSPEQCSGQIIDQRSDIYSLGCVFFEVLTGAPPFTSENVLSLMMQHQSAKPPTLQEASMGGKFPALLETIVQKMMAKRPDDRYQRLDLIAEDLMAVQQGKKVSAHLSTSNLNAESSNAQTRKINLLQVYIAIALTTVAGLLTFLAYNIMIASDSSNKKNTELLDDKKFPAVAEPVDQSAGAQYFSKIRKVSDHIEMRTFYFPTTMTLGKILYPSGTEVKTLHPTAGGVEILMIPGKPSITITEVNWDTLSQNPQILAKFRPDEVGLIDLSKNSFGRHDVADERIFDDVLYYIGSWTSLYAIPSMPKGVTDRGITQLVNLPPMRFFNPSETHATGHALAKMVNIDKTSNLQVDGLKDIAALMPRLKNSPRLKIFHAVADDLTDNDIKYLANVKTLQRLILRNNPRITDKGLSYLRHLQLERLAVDGCNITSKSIDTFKQMHISDKLSVDTSKWSPSDIVKLKSVVPSKVSSYKDELVKFDKDKKSKVQAKDVTSDLLEIK